MAPITRAQAETQLGKDASNLLFNLTPSNPLSSVPDEKGIADREIATGRALSLANSGRRRSRQNQRAHQE
jgi:hypothetical protein